VMADLEEAGFLQQLHTSSGRVPTNRGYRYYVDYLMRVQDLTFTERTRIEREFTQRLSDADEVMRQTSHLLALVSHQTGIVEAPSEANALVRSIELMPVSSSRLAVLVADSYGRVRTVMATIGGGIDRESLPRLRAFLNETLRGVSLDSVKGALRSRMDTLRSEQRHLADRACRLMDLLPGSGSGRLFLDGATQLFEQPEFRDVEKAREVFSLLDERDRLIELLRVGMRDGPPRTSVVIGTEVAGAGLEGISVVASPYLVDGRPAGMLGVLGPRRMPYSRLTALVGYTAGMLSRFLTRLAG